jgi:molecular chaperone GrpE
VTERHPHLAADRASAPEEHKEEPVVRDKRRIDPTTGEVRPDAVKAAAPAGGSSGQPGPQPAGQATSRTAAPPDGPGAGAGERGPTGEAEAGAVDDPVAALERQVAERTADLQRLQADYINYRRRVERDRDAVRETAVVNVLANLLPVLDDIGRAREHGELEGGFKSVGEALESTVEKLGLQRFGTTGETFNPTVHEALMHSYSGDVTEPTCVQVLQPGYRFGDRVVRPARVAVAEPKEPVPAPASDIPAEDAAESSAAGAAVLDSAAGATVGGAEASVNDSTATTGGDTATADDTATAKE